MASPLAAASAYASVARIASDASSLSVIRQPAEAKGDTSFASVLKDAIGSVVEMGQKSDAQTRAAAAEKGILSTLSRPFPRPRSRSTPWSPCAIA